MVWSQLWTLSQQSDRQPAEKSEGCPMAYTQDWLRIKSGFFPIFSASHIIAWLIFSLWYPNITCSLTITYSDIPCLHTHICFPFLEKTLHWRPYLYLLNSHLTNFNHSCISWRPLRTLTQHPKPTGAFSPLHTALSSPLFKTPMKTMSSTDLGQIVTTAALHFRLSPHLPREQ